MVVAWTVQLQLRVHVWRVVVKRVDVGYPQTGAVRTGRPQHQVASLLHSTKPFQGRKLQLSQK